MAGKPVRKEMCLACKRVIAESVCLITHNQSPIKIVVCKPCQDTSVEIAKMYEVAYGWNSYLTPPTQIKSIQSSIIRPEDPSRN